MRKLALALVLSLLAPVAATAAPKTKSNIKTLPICYEGELTITATGEVRPVYLGLRGRLDAQTFLTKNFVIGERASKISFTQTAPNVLRFNDNDDYIPGGAATFNLDVELTFAASTAVGTYKLFNYGENHGTGGFGQGDLAAATPTEVGTIQLKSCRISTQDFIAELERERQAAEQERLNREANANRP